MAKLHNCTSSHSTESIVFYGFCCSLASFICHKNIASATHSHCMTTVMRCNVLYGYFLFPRWATFNRNVHFSVDIENQADTKIRGKKEFWINRTNICNAPLQFECTSHIVSILLVFVVSFFRLFTIQKHKMTHEFPHLNHEHYVGESEAHRVKKIS